MLTAREKALARAIERLSARDMHRFLNSVAKPYAQLELFQALLNYAAKKQRHF